MRKIIYNAIFEKLTNARLGIQHISLWNNNIEQLSAQNDFSRPAVFIEFKPILWSQLGAGVRSADLQVKLHIVTEAYPSEAGETHPDKALEHLNFVENVSKVIQGLSGENFNCFTLIESLTDHKHHQLSDDQECYVTRLTDTSTHKLQTTVMDLELVQEK